MDTEENQILFSTPMVQAIQDNRKSMTRRVIKPQPNGQLECVIRHETRGGSCWMIPGADQLAKDFKFHKSYAVGDRLRVRETWKCTKYDSTDGNLGYEVEFVDGTRKYFEFDDGERFHQFGKFALKDGWIPSIYMPKEAARIWLEVTNVRVERLQEITEEDARAEGIIDGGCLNCGESEPCGCYNPQPDARDAFIYLWRSINEKRGYGWDTNPWVWVVEFKRLEVF